MIYKIPSRDCVFGPKTGNTRQLMVATNESVCRGDIFEVQNYRGSLVSVRFRLKWCHGRLRLREPADYDESLQMVSVMLFTVEKVSADEVLK